MDDVPDETSKAERRDPRAAAQLLPLVYGELRKLAADRLANERPGQTLQPTALVHEAYLRLVGATDPLWDGTGHFFAAAAEAMRRILVEDARRKRRRKHGGGQVRVDMVESDLVCRMPPDDLLALDESIARLAQADPAKARLVELRFFAGLSVEEAARVLGVSAATAKRHWRFAKAWLHRDVFGTDGPPATG